MRIRTRYKWFRILILAAILAFLFSLYDIFANDSHLFIPVMGAYLVLFVAGLLLYLGHKPILDEEGLQTEVVTARPEGEPAPTPPEEEEEAVEVVEVPKPARPRVPHLNVAGPHFFKCPFCSNLFAFEMTHLGGRKAFRMNCPYCANSIRIPRQPKVATQKVEGLWHPTPEAQALMTCTRCGEVLRITAPGSQWERLLHVQACPHCARTGVVPASA